MENLLVQFITDKTEKIKLLKNRNSFNMKLEEHSNGMEAIMAMREASSIAYKNGNADMTLDEINAEITEERNRLDYTKWQREYFDNMSPEEIDVAVKQYVERHPFEVKAKTVI
jgi:hypothetical protein